MSMGNARAAVLRGAKFLDTKRPNWYAEIDLDKLMMSGYSTCILGQLYRGYGVALDTLRLSVDDAELYGFCDDDTTNSRGGRKAYTYAELDRAWPELIRERRAAQQTSRLATEAVSDVMIEGKVTVGGKEILLPPVPLDYLLKLIEANR